MSPNQLKPNYSTDTMQETNNVRDFKGIWIPKEVYLNEELSWSAKIIFLEIDSFTSNDLPCFMSNEHIASFLKISERQVKAHISKLMSMGWIEQTGFDGRKRYLKSTMRFIPSMGRASTQPIMFSLPAEKPAKKKAISFTPPALEDVVKYFQDNGYSKEIAERAFKHYELGNWTDSNQKPVKNWKQKMHTNWFKPEHKSVPAKINNVNEPVHQIQRPKLLRDTDEV